jgi:hypothetical protein
MTYLAVLEAQLADLQKRFDSLTTGDLARVNDALKKDGAPPIVLPAAMAMATAAGGAEAARALMGWRFSLRDFQGVAAAAPETAERD